MSFAVVIPSRNIENLIMSWCAVQMREFDPAMGFYVIDDGLPSLPRENPLPMGTKVIRGIKPFVFARNVNLGITAALGAGHNGVVILNDDALLETQGGFTILRKAAVRNPEYGIIAASCNNTGNLNQRPHGLGLHEEPRMVCFTCVYIPRTTIEEVGLLDERFVGYGMDDDDYCLRVRNAGLKIGIHDDCFVDHATLESSYRGPAGAGGDFRPNMKLFIEKWGCDNWGLPAAEALKKWSCA